MEGVGKEEGVNAKNFCYSLLLGVWGLDGGWLRHTYIHLHNIPGLELSQGTYS